MRKVLLVEDDRAIVGSLSALLKQNDLLVTCADTQRKALECLENQCFDLLLLDVSLPDGSGYAVCAAARRMDEKVPILFLTASDDEYSVVAGLDMGADDYITKPFRPMELLSRIRTAFRRRGKDQALYQVEDVALDAVRGTVQKGGQPLTLSALEYKLLLMLMSRKGAVLTREDMLSALWDVGGDFVNDNTLTVYIKRLREKVEDDPQNPRVIRTVRGVGYKAGE